MAKKRTLLDQIIKILIILLLFGVLFLLALFIKDKLKSEEVIDNSQNIYNSQTSKPNKPPLEIINKKEPNIKGELNTTTSKDDEIDDSDKKIYSEEEMQEIMQMMIDQLQELNSSPQESNNDSDNLLDSLQALEDKELGEKNESSDKEIADEASIKEVAKSDNNHIDRYNKVVISNSQYSNENIDDLSRQIGEVIDDITSNDTKKSNYTNSIKREVRVREDAMRVIVVKRGDSLTKIAKRVYGTVRGYKRIVEANRDLIKNPNHIYVGQRLRIPSL